MIYVGIDPGLSGGIAFLDDEKLLAAYPTPLIEEEFIKGGKTKKRNNMDLGTIVDLLKDYKPDRCVLELVAARSGQGVTSMFRFGTGYGQYQGILAALDIKCDLIRPQVWKKHFGLLSDKEASLERARELWPEHTKACFRLKKHDGMAEAALMGLYGHQTDGVIG